MKTPRHKLASNKAWKNRNKYHLTLIAKVRWKLIQNNPELLKKKRNQDKKSRIKNYPKWRKYDSERDPVKIRARQAIRDRIYHGTLKRLPCEVCGNPKSQAHHEDYLKKLEVKWLCAKHHKEIHANSKN